MGGGGGGGLSTGPGMMSFHEPGPTQGPVDKAIEAGTKL